MKTDSSNNEISNGMNTQNRRAVVTGGAGFIGSHLVEALLKEGYDVSVIDSLVAGKREHVPGGAVLHIVDVRDADALPALLKDASVVFHLAALPSVEYSIKNPVETHNVNVTGTVNVLASAGEGARVVFASSAAVYGDTEVPTVSEDLPAAPVNPYGLHKYVSERYLALASKLYGTETVSLRFFNAYGPRLNPDGPYAAVVGRFLKLRKEGEPLTIVGDGGQTRDFIHVYDIVAALIKAGESPLVGGGEAINIGTGRGTSVNELADAFGGAREHLPARKEIRDSCADVSRAKELLGFTAAVSLADGIAEMKREWRIV
ncbi:MAG TPA: NAD-dependent epimerase/dehydratase family protein [Candidatus Paceibacterota bacterium]|nr:NAD-dependent epimerase/dehydratase family protein [Candidatus Paceibacterota bacterium]